VLTQKRFDNLPM